MQSKTSFFNKTLFRKNITRFAPVWVIYTLCLIVGVALVYTDSGADVRPFRFAQGLAGDVSQVMGGVNLCYALIVAQLLFGDLYNSRMCNAIHALPLRREGWFFTNILSGLCFSLAPTLVMTAVSLPLMAGSIVENAWTIPFLQFVSSNLQFICFFGIAVFSTMCVANRFTMIAGYGLVNFGAYIAYWMVDNLYTPLLYGIITPSRLAMGLTPLIQMVDQSFYDFTDYGELLDQQHILGVEMSELTASFSLTGEWWHLFAWAGVGIALMALALVLYRKRHLECAGDAVAFPVLVPVFQVLCALFVMAGVQFAVCDLFGLVGVDWMNWVILALGLILGWFVGRMLIERSTRVFRLKNFYGLGVLAAVIALSLVCAHFDILGIEDRLPKAEKVERVTLESNYTQPYSMEDPEDIAAMIELHRLALEDRPEGWGLHVKGYDGSWVIVEDSNDHLYDTTVENPDFTYAANIRLVYYLDNGATMSRRYNIWTETGAGLIAREALSRWDFLNREYKATGEAATTRFDKAMEKFESVYVESFSGEDLKIADKEEALSFAAAIQADCEAGTMVQDENFHKDLFRDPNPRERDGEVYYNERQGISITFAGKDLRMYINIYPDCENSIKWLKEHDMLDMEILRDHSPYWEALWEPVSAEEEITEVVVGN